MVVSKPIALGVIVLGLSFLSGLYSKGPGLGAAEKPSNSHTNDKVKQNNPGGNSYRTTNFVVEAPTTAIAEKIGRSAEQLRREQAIEWLGEELPTWSERCPIEIELGAAKGGYSRVFFDKGNLNQRISVSGSLQEILADVLPHEMTHVILANFWGDQVPAFPRWADEGAAMLGEGDARRRSYDFRFREVLGKPERLIAMRRLFSMQDYPPDWVAFYSQGNAVTRFLVESGGREKFLQFVKQGAHGSWDQAVQTHYHFRDVEELEDVWLTRLKANLQRKYILDIAIKSRVESGGWKTLCGSSLTAQEGKQTFFSSTTKIARPHSSEVYPAGYTVELTPIARTASTAIVKAKVEKSDAFELEDGQFEFQQESLVTIDEVNQGVLHKITFAHDARGRDKTVVELSLREVKEKARPQKAVANAPE